MVLISSNEVFDGTKTKPYEEADHPNPTNTYGISKFAAERHTQQLLNHFYIVRTSWMYSARGSNFIHRIQKIAGEKEPLSVVTDELGAPTWSEDLAPAILALTKSEQYGLYHLVNSGHTSRYNLARMVLDLTGRQGITIDPIRIEDYDRPSTPPKNGVLANVRGASIGIKLRPWDKALREFLKQTVGARSNY
jgi:dTDP-4-dehydrorhamnose reductase